MQKFLFTPFFHIKRELGISIRPEVSHKMMYYYINGILTIDQIIPSTLKQLYFFKPCKTPL